VTLYEQWLEAKEAENIAKAKRMMIEDELKRELLINDQQEGSETHQCGEFKVKVVSRLNKKIDADMLQQIAAEEGISEHLSSLFRWKPEINKKVWDNTSEEITSKLAGAITVMPGRPSFAISYLEEK